MARFTATRPSERRAPEFAGPAVRPTNNAVHAPSWFAASRWLAVLELEALPGCRINGNGNAAHPDSAKAAIRDSIRSGNRR
jgi:hypothetical protein